MKKVLELPDTDWFLIKSPKNNGDSGYWHVLYHKHGTNKTYAPTYQGGTSLNLRYRCCICGEVVPEAAEGFKNLCDWSEV